MSDTYLEKFDVVDSRIAAVEARLAVVEDGTSVAAVVAAKAEAAAASAVSAVARAEESAKSAVEAVARAEAAVVELTRKVDSLTVTQKTQLDILIRLDAVAANPHFKVILAIVATVLASWAASKGFK